LTLSPPGTLRHLQPAGPKKIHQVSDVGFAPKATVGRQNAIGRYVPVADIIERKPNSVSGNPDHL